MDIRLTISIKYLHIIFICLKLTQIKINVPQQGRPPRFPPSLCLQYAFTCLPYLRHGYRSQTEIATIREHFHVPAFRQCVLPSPISTTSFPSNLSQGVYKFIPQVGDPFPAYPSGHRSSPVYKIYTGMCNGFSCSTSGK